jgi:hypothetical protein
MAWLLTVVELEVHADFEDLLGFLSSPVTVASFESNTFRYEKVCCRNRLQISAGGRLPPENVFLFGGQQLF